MGSADGFSASKRFRHRIGRSSDCSSKQWWWGGQKCVKSSKWAPIWSIAQQPKDLWTSEDNGAIQRIKLVQNPSSRVFLTVVQSGGGVETSKRSEFYARAVSP